MCRDRKYINGGICDDTYLRVRVGAGQGSGICGFHARACAASQVVGDVGTDAGQHVAGLKHMFAPWS